MILFPNCKINLGLRILRRRPDGYHDIATVMYPTDWCDILEITPSKDGETHLVTTGNPVDCPPEKNLVMKAYNAVKQLFPSLPAVEINLHKIIPDGAGLGGGSADASFTILGLNEIFNLGLDKSKMAEIAAGIGSDCPFFIYNRPLLATGIGEIFSETEVDLTGYHLLIVKPHSSVSTKEAYAGVTPRDGGISPAEIVKSDVSCWKNSLVNDFEDSLFPNHPEIEAVKTKLYELGAVYASMTGSGAAVYGIFRELGNAEKAQKAFDGFTSHLK